MVPSRPKVLSSRLSCTRCTHAALLRAHGSVIVGRDVLEATVLAIYLELNAERQVRAATLGEPYVFSDDEIRAFQKGLEKRGLFEKCWNYYLAKFGLTASAEGSNRNA